MFVIFPDTLFLFKNIFDHLCDRLKMIAVEFSAVVSRETTVKTYDDNAFE